MSLWTAAEAAAATGGATRGDWSVTGIDIDTRTLAPGDLFVALTATRDGHDFVAQALEKGAGAALVSRVPEGLESAPLLVVPDVQAGLEALGRTARARTGAKVIAVTGSVGKTSTKEMLRHCAEGQRRTHAAVASFNNHWGVPITLARAPRDAELIVAELGMNAPGEIAPLSRMARPHVALITTVAPAHLEAFGRIEGIAAEKASIVEGLEPGGVAVLPAGLPTTPILVDAAEAAGANVVLFGEGGHWHPTGIDMGADRTWVKAETPLGPLSFSVGAPGRHFAVNALGALAALHAAGLDVDAAAKAMASWTPYAGRGTRETVRLPGGTVALWDDAFNANPASLSASLAVVAAQEGRKVAILGDMLELGPEEAAMHRALADDPSLAAFAAVHTVGPRMAHLHEALPGERRGRHFRDADSAARAAGELVQAGDTVLVKGSKGSLVSRTVAAIRALGVDGDSREAG